MCRYSIGKVTPQQSKMLTPGDFGPKSMITVRFPSKGSQMTRSGPSSDFKWKDYCPMVFRYHIKSKRSYIHTPSLMICVGMYTYIHHFSMMCVCYCSRVFFLAKTNPHVVCSFWRFTIHTPSIMMCVCIQCIQHLSWCLYALVHLSFFMV